jgi:hypothetical protein
MAHTVVSTSTLQWTPPSAAVNSGQSAFVQQASYNEQNVGTIGVPPATPPLTVFQIPFGSVSKAKHMTIKNLMTSDIDVALNGSADPITLPPGGKMSYECPVDASTGVSPLTEAAVTVLVSPTNSEKIEYWVFGD